MIILLFESKHTLIFYLNGVDLNMCTLFSRYLKRHISLNSFFVFIISAILDTKTLRQYFNLNKNSKISFY